MENAEEVMQLLEEFSKIKPKEIPRELEDYLGYVAKTGDPVFQWSLMRNLLREKLLGVITEFYESTLTVELPPCPNVEPFNYERMKTSLLERFDAFSGAPFTIQRICELLINPRKDYNRADKYMRAIEKNILVVSTREPGTGKRPLECDQSETVINGMPDVKLSESDGSLLHVPTDLPYLGAPPASNDVTIETTEPSSASIVDRVGLGINGDVNSYNSDDKLSNPKESHSSSVTQDSEQVDAGVEINDDVSSNIHGRSVEETDCDSNNRLSNVAERIDPCSDTKLDSSIRGMSSETSNLVLPDSIDSTDSKQEQTEPSPSFKLDEIVSDENEVSSSPADPPQDILNVQEEITEPTYSEAEATDTCIVQESETDVNLSPDSDNNSCDRVVLEDETKTISISEVTVTKSEEIDLECNEISGTVISPASPENTSQQSDESLDSKVHIELIEEYEPTNSHPDSSNDLCFQNKSIPVASESQKCEVDLSSEADSVSEESVAVSSKSKDNIVLVPDQSESVTVQEITEETLHAKPSVEESTENVEKQSPALPDLTEEAVVSESSSSSLKGDEPSSVTQSDVQSTSDIIVEMYENERRDESVIQSISQITPDSQEQITIEEINVDRSCEAEEEAMDVDDCSNQMLVSEGENEGEPMDEGDQVQS